MEKCMTKKSLSTIFSVFFLATACIAQSTNNLYGKSVQEVQLSISVSNSVIVVGSELVISAEIKNLSTNVIYLSESSPEMDFNVLLTSDSGKVYKLTPPAVVFTRLLRTDLKPGESRDWIIHVGINKYFEPPSLVATDKNIEPGDYILKATRHFSKNNSIFELESNLLKVQIK